MDILELIKAALYGLVEGITEWLPISSTGHMLLLENVLPLNVSKDFWDMFLVVIQLGAILAVCILYFGELNPFSSKKDAHQKQATWKLWAKIVVACIPAAAIGIPLDDWMEEHLGSPYVIATTLIAYGVLFILIENARKAKATRVAQTQPAAHLKQNSSLTTSELADADARVTTLEELDWPTAIGIGLFQVLSMVPGTSRSGSTIIGGLLLGCSRSVAANFTFFLAIPVMAGASGLRLVKFFLKGNSFATSELAILGVGCAVAFLVSLLVIKLLMGYIRRHDFKPFGWYRIVLGVVVVAYTLFLA